MTTLRDGDLAVYRTRRPSPERIAVTGGFAEVSERGLTVLAESAGAVTTPAHGASRRDLAFSKSLVYSPSRIRGPQERVE